MRRPLTVAIIFATMLFALELSRDRAVADNNGQSLMQHHAEMTLAFPGNGQTLTFPLPAASKPIGIDTAVTGMVAGGIRLTGYSVRLNALFEPGTPGNGMVTLSGGSLLTPLPSPACAILNRATIDNQGVLHVSVVNSCDAGTTPLVRLSYWY